MDAISLTCVSDCSRATGRFTLFPSLSIPLALVSPYHRSTKFLGPLEFQFSAAQKRTILLNRATLLLLTHKMDLCRELVNALASRQPSDERVVLLKAALLLHEKKPAKADELLAVRFCGVGKAGGELVPPRRRPLRRTLPAKSAVHFFD